MKMSLINDKGQAAAELAILGILILLAFSFVMNFGQSLGRVQQIKMESFRRALKKAYDKNGSASYTLKKNSNLASVNSSFFQGQDSAAENTGSVTWSKGLSGPKGTKDEGTYAYWQLNKTMAGDPDTGLPRKAQYQYSPTGQESDEMIKIPYSVYKVDETRIGGYTYSLNKQESNAGIDYSKRASVNDSSVDTLHTRINTNVDKSPGDDVVPVPHYEIGSSPGVSDTQIYTYAEGSPGNIQRWNVSHDDL